MVRKTKKTIPRELRRKLLVYCSHECCIPTCNARIGRNHIHHINGDPSDNREENLILLCPNCHEQVRQGIFKEKELQMYKKSKIKKVGVKELLEKEEVPSEKFRDIYSIKLDEIVKSLEKDEYDPELNDKIDELIMLLKEQIGKWNVPSVRHGTKELFLNLYKFSGEGKRLTNLYNVYKDLFIFAHSQRKHILGNMIGVFYSIWLETWTSDYGVEKAEKCCDILLRLGVDFLDTDLKVAEDCLNQISNASGDMFEPEILSREILFGTFMEKRKDESREMNKFFETILHYIKWDDIYSHDDERYDYLISSIEYAERIQDDYKIDITPFKENYLNSIIREIKDKEVKGFVDYLDEKFYLKEENREEIDEFDFEFSGELLEMMILAYRRVYPEIHFEIIDEVTKKNDKRISKFFNNMIDKNNYLRHVFRGEEMITSIDELIQFIERNSHFEQSKVGVGFWGFTFIHFKHSLKNDEKRDIERLVEKYWNSDFELDRECMSFEMDSLVYKKGKEGVKKIIQFLKELDEKVQVTKISSGVEFKFK